MKPTTQLTGAVLEHIKASNPFLQRAYPGQARKGATSPDIAAFLSGTDLEQDQRGARLVNPYAESAWIYTAVSILAQSVAQIPFRISRVGGGKAKRVRAFRGSADPAQRAFCRRALGETILDSGDVVDLFEHPHPTMNKQLFWETVVTWNALRGEFFILPQDRLGSTVDLSDRAPRIANMIALCPDMFWHIVVGYELEGWRYTGSPLISPVPSEILLPTEVCYSRTPNPYLYWRGLSPLIVALVPAQTDFAGEQFQKGLWVNNADTGVIVTTDQQATKEQQASILQALRERKRKAGTADRPMFLWGGAKVEKPSLSMMDMQFLETRKFLRQEIFSIFKVPESLAGFTSDLNDGGAGGSLDAIKGSFVESTVSALCHRCETAVQPIIDTFGDDLVGWFDIDSMPIMQAQRRARLSSATTLFAMGVPMDDINTTLDLGLPDRAWYKKGWLPFNLQDASAPTEPLPGEDDPNNPAPMPDDNDDDEAKSNPFVRMQKLLSQASTTVGPESSRAVPVKALWEKHMAARRSSINLFQSKTAKVLNQYRGKALAKLNEIHLEKSAGRLGEIKSLVDLIFSANSFGQSLGDELQAPWQSLLQNAGTELLNEIGAPDDAWKYPPKSVIEFIADRKQTIMGCGQTVRNQVNTTLEEGLTAGESNQQLADRIRAVFTTMTKSEAKRVASTEVNVTYNNARHQAMTDAGIEYKSWLSSHGPHVRAAHAEAEEAYLDDPIPLTEPFVVMEEELMFPGDDSLGASPENIINCQCVQLAAEKKSEDEKSVTYQIPGIGLMTWQKGGGQ